VDVRVVERDALGTEWAGSRGDQNDLPLKHAFLTCVEAGHMDGSVRTEPCLSADELDFVPLEVSPDGICRHLDYLGGARPELRHCGLGIEGETHHTYPADGTR
jgi:hypothetical protein